ncbi:MAG: hypothetical protein ACE5FD_01805 [Anaerolineae bacterium]
MLAHVTNLVMVDQVDSFRQAEDLARTQKVNVVIIDQAENMNDQTELSGLLSATV